MIPSSICINLVFRLLIKFLNLKENYKILQKDLENRFFYIYICPVMLLFNLQFRYDDETCFRPYVVNCDFCNLDYYVKRVSGLACVAQINIDIFSPDSMVDYELHEYTI